jgi:hypothetical protein
MVIVPLMSPVGETASAIGRKRAGRRSRRTARVRRAPAHLDDRRLNSYSVTVKNITVTLDDETYRRARIKAAELETSVSALVRRYLVDLAGGESEFDRLEKLERTLRERIASFRAGDRLSRDEVHKREG